MNEKNTGDDPKTPWHHSRLRKQESVSLCTQSIIHQKGKHNALRTEDGKIPGGCKVGGKTNLKRHLKSERTALLCVWISQLTGMWRDQFLMTNIFKRWKTGKEWPNITPLCHTSLPPPDIATDRPNTDAGCWGLGEFFPRSVGETGWHAFINSSLLQAEG